MENIDDIQLGLTKFRADSTKYFSLFDKHIPRFENDGKGRKILMLGLSNEGMMLKCCALNKNAEYFVTDLAILSETLPLLGPEYDFSFFDGNLDLYDIIKDCDMKFDCIIMNPPYQRNLHLKILAEAIKHITKNGECICLAPSLYTNYKSDKNMKMLPSTYEIISPEDASKLFSGIQLQDSLLITTWNNKNHISKKEIYDKFVPIGFSIVKKLKFKTSFNNVNILNYANEKYFVPLKLMTARWDKNKDIIIDKLGLLINGYTLNGQYYKDVRNKNKDRPCGGIAFKTKTEAINFINSCNTMFFKFLVKMLHTNSRYVLKDYPFMEDYTEPWTDERFYKFFNITPAEQKIIEETMEKYK